MRKVMIRRYNPMRKEITYYGEVGEETELMDSKGETLRVGDVVSIDESFFETIMPTYFTEEQKQNTMELMKKDFGEEIVTFVANNLKKGYSLVMGMGSELTSENIENIIKVSKYVTKLPIGVEKYVNSDKNKCNFELEVIS